MCIATRLKARERVEISSITEFRFPRREQAKVICLATKGQIGPIWGRFEREKLIIKSGHRRGS